ncbi:glycosyltransferase family 4 protein [Methanocalculus natronophilus]|uniref:glycosyltransferase family 4 protein n=1 Tax=Methanocalculus natronophilus TaxID=1262400 RepID=UPI0031B5D65C
MRIVYIATSTIPSRTANSIHVMKMCQAFAQNGHEVTLIVPDWKEGIESGVEDVYEFYGVERCFSIKYCGTQPGKLNRITYGLKAVKQAKKLSPHILYSRDVVTSYFATLQYMQVIFESHAPIKDSGIFSNWIFQRLISMPTLKKIIVITQALKKYYLDNYPIPPETILVAPDGADMVPEQTIPFQFPNQGRKLQVGYVGHLYKGRGIDIICQLADICSWADFHIIGGRDTDIHYLQNNTSHLSNLYIHGFKTPRDAERYRLGCDVLIAPYQLRVSVFGKGDTTTENWMSPMKIFEYMAVGKAIVASDLPVLREVLYDEYNALLCDPEDIDTWVIAMTRLLNNTELRFKLGENAKSEFYNKYTWYVRSRNIIIN